MGHVQGIWERGGGEKFSGMIIFHYTYIYEVLKVKAIAIQHGELLHMNFRVSKELALHSHFLTVFRYMVQHTHLKSCLHLLEILKES